MSKNTKKQSNGYCYTVNNYTDNDIAAAMAMYEDDTNAKYAIIGFEVGDREETPHMQCYIYYTKKITKGKFEKYIIEHFDKNLHSEAQSSKKNVAAYVYCMEDMQYYEMGNRPRQGHRTDLEVIKHDILSGKSEKNIANEYFSQWCQYRRAFNEFRYLNKKKKTKILLYGRDEDEMYECHKWFMNNGYNVKIYTTQCIVEAFMERATGVYDYILYPYAYAGTCKTRFTYLSEWIRKNIV